MSLCCFQLVSRGTLCVCTTICAGGRAASAATTASRRRGARGHHHRPRSGRPRHFVLRLGHPENVVVSAGGDAGGSGLPRAGVSTEAGRPPRVTRLPPRAMASGTPLQVPFTCPPQYSSGTAGLSPFNGRYPPHPRCVSHHYTLLHDSKTSNQQAASSSKHRREAETYTQKSQETKWVLLSG